MDALERSKGILQNLSSGIDNGLTWKFEEFNCYVSYAQVYAAIAQAEQLKRIADSLEELEKRPVLQMRNL